MKPAKKYNTLKGTLTTAGTYVLAVMIPEASLGDVAGPLQNTAFIITILVGAGTLIKLFYYFKDRARSQRPPEDEDGNY